MIWKIPASGGHAVRVSPGIGRLAIESSDGAYLYYSESATSDRPGPLRQLSLKAARSSDSRLMSISTAFAVVDEGSTTSERVAGGSRLLYFDVTTRQSTVIASGLGNVDPASAPHPTAAPSSFREWIHQWTT